MKRITMFGFAVLVAAVMAFGCSGGGGNGDGGGGDEQKPLAQYNLGEGERCTPVDTCAEGLSCVSEICAVSPPNGLGTIEDVPTLLNPPEPPPAVNSAPVVNLSCPEKAYLATKVVCNASGSIDPEGKDLIFNWTMDAGNVVPQQGIVEFVVNEKKAVSVNLTVSDGELETKVTASVQIVDSPVANIGFSGIVAIVGVGDTIKIQSEAPTCSDPNYPVTTKWFITGQTIGIKEEMSANGQYYKFDAAKNLLTMNKEGKYQVILEGSCDGLPASQNSQQVAFDAKGYKWGYLNPQVTYFTPNDSFCVEFNKKNVCAFVGNKGYLSAINDGQDPKYFSYNFYPEINDDISNIFNKGVWPILVTKNGKFFIITGAGKPIAMRGGYSGNGATVRDAEIVMKTIEGQMKPYFLLLTSKDSVLSCTIDNEASCAGNLSQCNVACGNEKAFDKPIRKMIKQELNPVTTYLFVVGDSGTAYASYQPEANTWTSLLLPANIVTGYDFYDAITANASDRYFVALKTGDTTGQSYIIYKSGETWKDLAVDTDKNAQTAEMLTLPKYVNKTEQDLTFAAIVTFKDGAQNIGTFDMNFAGNNVSPVNISYFLLNPQPFSQLYVWKDPDSNLFGRPAVIAGDSVVRCGLYGPNGEYMCLRAADLFQADINKITMNDEEIVMVGGKGKIARIVEGKFVEKSCYPDSKFSACPLAVTEDFKDAAVLKFGNQYKIIAAADKTLIESNDQGATWKVILTVQNDILGIKGITVKQDNVDKGFLLILFKDKIKTIDYASFDVEPVVNTADLTAMASGSGIDIGNKLAGKSFIDHGLLGDSYFVITGDQVMLIKLQAQKFVFDELSAYKFSKVFATGEDEAYLVGTRGTTAEVYRYDANTHKVSALYSLNNGKFENPMIAGSKMYLYINGLFSSVDLLDGHAIGYQQLTSDTSSKLVDAIYKDGNTAFVGAKGAMTYKSFEPLQLESGSTDAPPIVKLLFDGILKNSGDTIGMSIGMSKKFTVNITDENPDVVNVKVELTSKPEGSTAIVQQGTDKFNWVFTSGAIKGQHIVSIIVKDQINTVNSKLIFDVK